MDDNGKDHQGPKIQLSSSAPKRERKIEELKGSRWTGLILLFITVLISLLFSLRGQFARKEMKSNDFFGTQTYRFEK